MASRTRTLIRTATVALLMAAAAVVFEKTVAARNEFLYGITH